MSDLPNPSDPAPQSSKRDERLAFILLAVVLAPVLSVAIVGGWGFMIWILQMIYGPPAG